MIVLLGSRGRSTRIVANYLAQHFDLTLIVEESVSPIDKLRRRARKLGVAKVAGQLIFLLFAKWQYKASLGRITEIERCFDLRTSTPTVPTYSIRSANDLVSIQLLRELSPDVVVVNGTRILSDKVLASIDAPFINTHAGITPQYRGVHGAYWALAQGDPQNAGVTVHLVDPGIDTGGVLYRATVTPTCQDCFATYPTLQLAAGLPLLRKAVEDAIQGALRIIHSPNRVASRLYYHPTICQYLRIRRRGIR
jgi:phosphoribosylglycinamide formyltransferase 1